MRKIRADKIFPISSPPLDKGVLVLSDSGTILDVLSANEIENFEDVENFEGFLCPGFVNTHCHLELSHLHGKLKRNTRLHGFIEELQQIRDVNSSEIQQAIIRAENDMLQNGIIAVADVANGSDSFFQKAKQNLFYHTFIEVFGFNEKQSDSIFSKATTLCNNYIELVNSCVSITPHAPYSVSQALFQQIVSQFTLISIHNQESNEENIMFTKGEGLLINMLKKFGIETENWNVPNKHSLPFILEKIKEKIKILLVHNTFTSLQDIETALQSNVDAYWCFCPNANLYIENTLPDIPLFLKNNCKITLGTDSLASNNKLCILEEIKTIQKYYPQIADETVLKWATLNGAEFMGIEKHVGSFEKNKAPGVLLIGKDFLSVKKLINEKLSTI